MTTPSAGATTVEVGRETYPVAVDETTGDEQKTAGIRTIPVPALTRST